MRCHVRAIRRPRPLGCGRFIRGDASPGAILATRHEAPSRRDLRPSWAREAEFPVPADDSLFDEKNCLFGEINSLFRKVPLGLQCVGIATKTDVGARRRAENLQNSLLFSLLPGNAGTDDCGSVFGTIGTAPLGRAGAVGLLRPWRLLPRGRKPALRTGYGITSLVSSPATRSSSAANAASHLAGLIPKALSSRVRSRRELAGRFALVG